MGENKRCIYIYACTAEFEDMLAKLAFGRKQSLKVFDADFKSRILEWENNDTRQSGAVY